MIELSGESIEKIKQKIWNKEQERKRLVNEFNAHPIAIQFQVSSALLNGQIMALNDLIEDEEPIVEQDESKQVEKSINGVSR